MTEQPNDDKHWEQYRKPKENKMNEIDIKLNKPLIVISYIIVFCLNARLNLNESLIMYPEVNDIFIQGGLPGTFAKWVFILAALLVSPIGIFWFKVLWNNFTPRITNWGKINFLEAMGIATIIFLFAYMW